MTDETDFIRIEKLMDGIEARKDKNVSSFSKVEASINIHVSAAFQLQILDTTMN